VQAADQKNWLKWLNRTVTDSFTPDDTVIALYDSKGRQLPTDAQLQQTAVPATIIQIPELLQPEQITENALTLDSCTYRIDGGDWQPKKAVIRLFQELLQQKKPCEVELQYPFIIECEPQLMGKLFLAAETVNQFEVCVNGHPIRWDGKSTWMDQAFQKCDITPFVCKGQNTVFIRAHFYQRELVYQALFSSDVLSTAKNMMTFDTELKSIYIVGNFGVFSRGGFVSGARNALTAADDFFIDRAPTVLHRGSITQQGYTFFAGRAKLGFDALIAENAGRVVLHFTKRAAACRIWVNSKPVRCVLWAPCDIDITDYVTPGQNRITLGRYRLYR